MYIKIDGVALRTCREGKFLSQTQLARLADMRPETLCRLEKGDHQCRRVTWLKLAEALGVPPAEIQEQLNGE